MSIFVSIHFTIINQILDSSKFSRGSVRSVDFQADMPTLEGSNSHDKTHYMSLYRQVVHKQHFKVYLVDVKGAV